MNGDIKVRVKFRHIVPSAQEYDVIATSVSTVLPDPFFISSRLIPCSSNENSLQLQASFSAKTYSNGINEIFMPFDTSRLAQEPFGRVYIGDHTNELSIYVHF